MKINIANLKQERMGLQVKMYKARQIKKEIDKMPYTDRFDGSRNCIENTYYALMQNLKGRLFMIDTLLTRGSK